jgi:hypothetical protein
MCEFICMRNRRQVQLLSGSAAFCVLPTPSALSDPLTLPSKDSAAAGAVDVGYCVETCIRVAATRVLGPASIDGIQVGNLLTTTRLPVISTRSSLGPRATLTLQSQATSRDDSARPARR